MRSIHVGRSIEDRINEERGRLLEKIRKDLGENFGTVPAAKWLGKSRALPVLLIRTGRLRAMRCGRQFLIAAADLADFLARGYVSVSETARRTGEEQHAPRKRRKTTAKAAARGARRRKP